MNRKISITTKQLERLLEDFQQIPDDPVGEHLTDDEAIGYAMESISVEERKRADSHLVACSACAEEVERLMAGAAVWNGEQGAKRLSNLRDIIRAKMQKPKTAEAGKSLTQIAEQLARFILPVGLSTPAPLRAKHLVSSTDRQAEDDRFLRCREIPDEQGNLVLRIASHELRDGTRLLLFVEGSSWQRVVRLSRVTPDQVGARLEITREEREAWPANAMLEFGIPREDLDQALEQGER